MPSHIKASAGSRSLCDRLQDEMRKLIPDLAASSSEATCGLYQPGHNRFAYVYHRSDAELIRVYFRGDPIVLPSDSRRRLTIQIRPKIDKGWDKEFPFFIVLDGTSDIRAAAEVLREFACPLATRKTRKKFIIPTIDSDIHIPEEIPDGTQLSEGATKTIKVNVYERNPTARLLCIKHYGAKCHICKFDFQKTYGDLGKGYIHVHHIKPLAEIKASYRVNPVEDFRPVCPNCHAMIHRTIPPAKCEDIREILKTGATPS